MDGVTGGYNVSGTGVEVGSGYLISAVDEAACAAVNELHNSVACSAVGKDPLMVTIQVGLAACQASACTCNVM